MALVLPIGGVRAAQSPTSYCLSRGVEKIALSTTNQDLPSPREFNPVTKAVTTNATTTTTLEPNSSTSTFANSSSSTPTSFSSSTASTHTSPASAEGDTLIAVSVLLALVIIGAVAYFRWRGGVFRTGDRPQPKIPPALLERKETYAYEASMHSDATGRTGGAGHAWPDLRVTKTITEDSVVTSTEVTEYEYDFVPQGSNVFYTKGDVVSRKRTKITDRGSEEPLPSSDIASAYFSITEEGFKAAKAWVDSTVTSDEGRVRISRGRPPNYKILTYNCVNYTLELCTRAGVDVSDYKQSGPSTPSNLASIMSQKNCGHEWELHSVSHPGLPVLGGESMRPPPTPILVCKSCGLSKPYEESTEAPPPPPPPPASTMLTSV